MEVRLEQSGPDTASKAAQGSKRKGQRSKAGAVGCYWSAADTAVMNSMTQAALHNGSSVQIQQSKKLTSAWSRHIKTEKPMTMCQASQKCIVKSQDVQWVELKRAWCMVETKHKAIVNLKKTSSQSYFIIIIMIRKICILHKKDYTSKQLTFSRQVHKIHICLLFFLKIF